MKNRKKIVLPILASLVVASLAACGGSKKDPASSGSVPSEESSTSSEEQVFAGPNAYALAEQIAKSANKVLDTPITAEALLAKAKAIDPKLSSNTEDAEVYATEGDIMILIYAAFGDKMPLHTRTGARKFEGIRTDLEALTLVGCSKADGVFEAIQWFAGLGLFSPRQAGRFDMNKRCSPKQLLTYLDRIHNYLGESYVDDMHSTANHDWLYEREIETRDQDGDGICDGDEDGDGIPDEDDTEVGYDNDGDGKSDYRVNTYDSRMIPQEHINAWAKSYFDAVPAAKAFNDSFLNFDRRVAGDCSGLSAAVNSLTAATSLSELYDVLLNMVKDTGYCPLWGELQFGKYTITSTDPDTNKTTEYYRDCGIATSYNNTTTYTNYVEGFGNKDDKADSYVKSVYRFAPIFQEAMGYTEEEAMQWSKNYATFKYHFGKAYVTVKSADKDKQDSLYGIAKDLDPEYPEMTDPQTTMVPGSTDKTLYNLLKATGIKDPEWFYFQSEYDAGALFELFKDETMLPYIQGLFVWQMLNHYSLCLPDAPHVNGWLYNPGYANNEPTLSEDGMWGYYCLPHISGILSNHYLTTPECDAAVAEAVQLMEDLKDSMRARIQKNTWLSAKGKEQAAKKLDTLRYSIAGKNSDGSKLHYLEPEFLPSAGLYQNLGIEANLDYDTWAAVIGDDWTDGDSSAAISLDFFDYCNQQDPLTANAFYMASANAIDIYTGFLAAYEDITTMTVEEKLALIGWTLGHELSHGFDDNGMEYDETGAKNSSFLPTADKNNFTKKIKDVRNAYNGYEVMPGQETPGSTIVGEAIADINGINLCLDIADKLTEFDYERFFILGAEDMGAYASQYTYAQTLKSDEHPFGRGRCNPCFMQLDKFHETFGTQEGDGMYVAPENRIVIW